MAIYSDLEEARKKGREGDYYVAFDTEQGGPVEIELHKDYLRAIKGICPYCNKKFSLDKYSELHTCTEGGLLSGKKRHKFEP